MTPLITITSDYGIIGPFHWHNAFARIITFKGRRYRVGRDGYFGIGDCSASFLHRTNQAVYVEEA